MNSPEKLFFTDELQTLIPGVPKNFLDANVQYLCDKGLINPDTQAGIGRGAPIATRISALGVDFVEKPSHFQGQFTINVQTLSIGTNYGQVAQADRGATIEQTQTYSSFNELRELVRKHAELNDEDRQRIEKVLARLEERATQKGLTQKIIDEAQQALAEYVWLIPPLVTTLAKALGLG
jgi:hypothetical protein